MDSPTRPPVRWSPTLPPSPTAPTVIRPRPDRMEAALALGREARAAAREARRAQEDFSPEERARLAYRLRLEGCATCGRALLAASLAAGPDDCPACLDGAR